MGKNPIKALAGQTVVYGLGTMLPRFLNYLMVKVYTSVFPAEEYGQVTEVYAWTALFLAVLIFGMETTFFRFAQKIDPKKAFNNAGTWVILLSTVFILLFVFLFKYFAAAIGYDSAPEYVLLFGLIVFFDAICAVPFAMLRQQNAASRFSIIKIINVCFNIGLNIFFIYVIPEQATSWARVMFGPEASLLVWVFIANVISSAFNILLLIPQFKMMRLKFDKDIIFDMLKYSWPILLIGLIGMVNEVADKLLIRSLVPIPDDATLSAMGKTADAYRESQIGIYGANYKLAVLMTIFIQMFRFASEPFFFGHAKDRNAPGLYSRVMTIFTAFCLLIFLVVMLYIDVFKYFIGSGSDNIYHEGLVIVPIVLIANMFYGIVFNLSIWYKLSDRTSIGSVITSIGAVTTVLILIGAVPLLGYKGAALAHLGCYFVMMLVSYFWGQKVFPIPYQVGRIAVYFIIAMAAFFISFAFAEMNIFLRLTINTILILLFIGAVVVLEKKNPIKID